MLNAGILKHSRDVRATDVLLNQRMHAEGVVENSGVKIAKAVVL